MDGFWLLAYIAIAAQGLVDNPTNLNIVNPAAAALTAHSLLKIAAWIQHVIGARRSLAFMAAILLMIGGLGRRALKGFAFYPWAKNDYKLGLALRQISQPHELVITATTIPGDAVAVYYSQRRGWVFPPIYAWSSLYDLNDEDGIRSLEELIGKGDNWLGIVNQQQFARTHPKLSAYMDRNLERYQATSEFLIYRIRS